MYILKENEQVLTKESLLETQVRKIKGRAYHQREKRVFAGNSDSLLVQFLILCLELSSATAWAGQARSNAAYVVLDVAFGVTFGKAFPILCTLLQIQLKKQV
jgi:hypothetical protein